jgi:putative acetyltransferase
MTAAAAPLVVRVAEWDDPAGARMRDEQQAEIRAMFGGVDTEPGQKPTAASVSLFLIAERGGLPVGCGALREIDGRHGEIKRMYVQPDARGAGTSIALLAELEAQARRRGWNRVVLETGTEQRAAIRFYEREGFTPIPCWGAYAASAVSLCYEKPLG